MGSNRSLPNGPRHSHAPSFPPPTPIPHTSYPPGSPDPQTASQPSTATRHYDSAARQCAKGPDRRSSRGPHHREVQERRRATAAAGCSTCCPARPLQSALLGERRPGAGCGRPAGQLASRPPRSGAQGQGAAYSTIWQRANTRKMGAPPALKTTRLQPALKVKVQASTIRQRAVNFMLL